MRTNAEFTSLTGSLACSVGNTVENLRGKKNNLFQNHIATRAIILASFPCFMIARVLDIIVMVGALIGRAVTPKSSPYYERFKTSLKDVAVQVALIPLAPIAFVLQLVAGEM